MAKGTARTINKKLTPEERSRHQRIRQQVEGEKSELMAHGRRAKAHHTRLQEALAELKATRQKMGLSLTDIGARTGIEKSNLSRLENAPHPNPTVDTLTRYATAVGKEIVITLIEKNP
jgi:hypothetical protein